MTKNINNKNQLRCIYNINVIKCIKHIQHLTFSLFAVLINSDEDERPENLQHDQNVEMQQHNSPGLDLDADLRLPDLGADQPEGSSHCDHFAVPQASIQQAMQLSGADFGRFYFWNRASQYFKRAMWGSTGGESRRTYLKRKASKFSRSAYEIFVLSTSRTT